MQAIAAENNLAETAFLVRELGKTAFRAFQASRRGGEITCRLAGDRVFYLEGQVEI
jgi:hypothetical protein